MASRNTPSSTPVSWLRRIYRRLTSRMACFVWGALLGNALLSQPIDPLNLLLAPSEQMFTPAVQQALQRLRQTSREAADTLAEVLREQLIHTLRR